MSKTATVTASVSECVKERLEAIARERGVAGGDEVVAEAVEQYVTEYDAWKREIGRRRDVPHEKRRYVDRAEGRAWIKSLGTG